VFISSHGYLSPLIQWRSLWLRAPNTESERLYADHLGTPNSRLISLREQFFEVTSAFPYRSCSSGAFRLTQLVCSHALVCVQLCKKHSLGLYTSLPRFVSDLRALEMPLTAAALAFQPTVNPHTGESNLMPPLVFIENEAVLPLPAEQMQLYTSQQQYSRRVEAECTVALAWKEQCPAAAASIMLAFDIVIKQVSQCT
jgi:hypothetical protein